MNLTAKLLGTMVLAAAIAAPVAHAGGPDDRAGLRGPGGISAQQARSEHPDNRSGLRGPGAFATPAIVTAVRPDDRAGTRGPGAIDGARPSLHPDNRADARGPGALTTTVVMTSGSTGFDWSDAFIGGVAGVGAALLATGCFFILFSRRSTRRFA